jgi:DnaJ-class molecular chaperone
LRLKTNATDDEIRAAYKKLAFENHPDRAKSDRERAAKQRRMNDINRAYETLTKRKAA